MSQYMELREKWPEFIYEGYYIEETEEEIKVRYRFRIPGLSDFAPEWKFPKDASRFTQQKNAREGVPKTLSTEFKKDPVFRNMIFSLGMVELVSYWKICCPPTVWVEAGSLDQEQVTWWKELYYNGLGEFFYTNRIREADPDTFMDIRCRAPQREFQAYGISGSGVSESKDWQGEVPENEEQQSEVSESKDRQGEAPENEDRQGEMPENEDRQGEVSESRGRQGDMPESEDRQDKVPEGEGWQSEMSERQEETQLPPLNGCLIPVGGGKDSVVTMELVKKTGMRSMVYVINPRGATVSCNQAGGYGPDRQVMVSRTLDANMLRLNREGYLNGHTPFSAIVAFSAVAAAYLYRLKYVALSNESSANESTVPGSTVNHQYSKSFQFESDFNSYERKYLKSGVFYFSLLRPLSEFQIARYFAGLKQYHPVFKSCNVGSKQDVWCGHCPKCLFVYLILSPFLPQEELRQMFGADMLNDPSLTETLEQLVGIQEEKPFECVGSRNEINAAIAMTIERMERNGEELPALLRYYRQSSLYAVHAHRDHGYFTYYDKENLLPEEFERILRRECL